MIRKDLMGQKFNWLTVIDWIVEGTRGKWLCKCDCGNERLVRSNELTTGHITSCGCQKSNSISKSTIKMKTTHGKSRSKIHTTWKHIKGRCLNEKDGSYKNYGGRGIKICDEWLTFEGFYRDMGDVPNKMSIERKDVNGNYCKDNCTWATVKEQANNKRSSAMLEYYGQIKTMKRWSELKDIPYKVLHARIKLGWDVKRALETPVRILNKRINNKQAVT
jgi:hypothetical protein